LTEILLVVKASRFVNFEAMRICIAASHGRHYDNAQVRVPRMDLLELLRSTATCEATNPKDKLYALLGMDVVKDVIVKPNYGDSVEKVFTDFAVNCIQTRSTIEILHIAGIGLGSQT